MVFVDYDDVYLNLCYLFQIVVQNLEENQNLEMYMIGLFVVKLQKDR